MYDWLLIETQVALNGGSILYYVLFSLKYEAFLLQFTVRYCVEGQCIRCRFILRLTECLFGITIYDLVLLTIPSKKFAIKATKIPKTNPVLEAKTNEIDRWLYEILLKKTLVIWICSTLDARAVLVKFINTVSLDSWIPFLYTNKLSLNEMFKK